MDHNSRLVECARFRRRTHNCVPINSRKKFLRRDLQMRKIHRAEMFQWWNACCLAMFELVVTILQLQTYRSNSNFHLSEIRLKNTWIVFIPRVKTYSNKRVCAVKKKLILECTANDSTWFDLTGNKYTLSRKIT